MQFLLYSMNLKKTKQMQLQGEQTREQSDADIHWAFKWWKQFL